MKKVNFNFLFALVILVLFLSSCESNEAGTARIQISLVDAPAAYDAVNIEILEVKINSASDTSGWASLESAETGIFDVLKLTNGEEAFLGEVELPEGQLGQVRLVLGSNNSLVIDGETYELKVPSGSQSGLKLNINAEIVAGFTYKLILDFDAAKSVVKAGNSGRYNLKPVIRASMEAQTGAIAGVVSPAEAEVVVFAISETDTISSFADETGAFLVRALEAGTYDLSVVPADTSLYQVAIVENILVEVGVKTELDSLYIQR